MRIFSIALTLVPALFTANAQPPAAEDAAAVLRGWEKAMADAKNFGARVHRFIDDKPLDAKDEHRGYVLLAKSDKTEAGVLARLDITKVTNKDVFERFICNGPDLYEYVPAKQAVRVHRIPRDKLGGPESTLLSFLLGTNAKQAMDRHQVKFDEKAPRDGYHYVLLYPKDANADFAVAHLTFHRSNHLLARLWYRQKNGSEITWTFTDLQTNIKQLPAAQFQPELPKGWRFDNVKAVP